MRPTIVLVHGAFAESSSWDPVIDRLLDAGHPVVAVANPLRGLASDAASVSDHIRSVDGPIVLVGHSYGGAVITNVDPDAGEIVGLVYVAAFAPEPGDSCFELSAVFPGSTLGDALQAVPRSDGTTDVTIVQERFHEQFCADVPAPQAARMAADAAPRHAGGARRALGRPAAVEGAAVVVRVRRGGPQHPEGARALHGRARGRPPHDRDPRRVARGPRRPSRHDRRADPRRRRAARGGLRWIR